MGKAGMPSWQDAAPGIQTTSQGAAGQDGASAVTDMKPHHCAPLQDKC